jgi:dehydrogenase/reductase SDR family protein 12
MSRLRLAGGVDAVLEASVVGSFTKIGHQLRSRLFDWSAPARLDGKTVMITGATSGIGLAAATRIAGLGASVCVVGRDPAKVEATVDRLGVTGEVADLADLGQVRALAARFLAGHERLDVLVHNAGALLHEDRRTVDGLETTVQTHVVAPYVLTRLLQPALVAADPGRVVWVTSGGMYTQRLSLPELVRPPLPFDGSTAYARAKRAQMALVERWAKREDRSVVMHAMHPGWVDTPGVASSLPRFHRVMGPLLRSPDEGADTIVWLAGAREAATSSGTLWLDRRPRATHRWPRTRGADEAAEADRLAAWCDRFVP